MKSAPYWLFKIITALIKTSADIISIYQRKWGLKWMNFKTVYFYEVGWEIHSIFLAVFFSTNDPVVAAAELKLKYIHLDPLSFSFLPPPLPSPLTFDISLSVCSFYVLCKFSFGLRVTARKTIKQRRGKFKPGAASSSTAMSGVCCSYKWTEHNVNAGTRKKPTKSSRLQITAYQEINIFIPKKHGTMGLYSSLISFQFLLPGPHP